MNRPRILALLIPTLTAVGLYLTLDWAEDRATATSERAAMTDTLQAGQTLESRARGPIQAYSQELQTTIFDTDGALQYTLHADSQTQFEDQTSLLTQPRITLFEAGKPNWNITADYGRIEGHPSADDNPSTESSAEEELVRFIGNASLNAALANTSTLALQSSEFSLIPSVEKIRSDKPVRVIDQGINQTAIGFEANLAEDSLYFDKEIRGTYEPPR
jgi:lipopolysaccharide export system protein LptC